MTHSNKESTVKVQHYPVGLLAAVLTFAACSDSMSTRFILANDEVVTADVAASAGDAISTTIENMTFNEGAASLAIAGSNVVAATATATANANTNTLTYSRTRTCYDAAGAVVNNCTPLSSVRKIVTHVTADGTRSGTSTTTGGATANWTGAVHRVANDTLQRVFNTAQPPVETSRIHSDLSTARDTTTFTHGDFTRVASEAANDTVKAVTFNLPRSQNPWPVSGKIVRAVTVHVVATKGDRTETRDVKRTVTVTFPADAQGNVVMTVNDKTCNLNLVTHAVTNCQ